MHIIWYFIFEDVEGGNTLEILGNFRFNVGDQFMSDFFTRNALFYSSELKEFLTKEDPILEISCVIFSYDKDGICQYIYLKRV